MPSNRRRWGVALVFVGVTALAVASGVTVADSSGVSYPSATERPTPVIQESNVTVPSGGVVTLTVSVPPGGNATLRVDGLAFDGDRQFRLRDRSGDGTVTVDWNTYVTRRGTNDSLGVSARGEDTISGSPLGTVSTGTYWFTVEDGSEEDTASVRVREPAEASIQYFVAPRDRAGALDSAQAIERARRSGWLRPDNDVALGEALVVRLHDPALAGAVRAQSGETTAKRFRRLNSRVGTRLEVVERRLAGSSYVPIRFNASEYATGIYSTNASRTHYLVLNTSTVAKRVGRPIADTAYNLGYSRFGADPDIDVFELGPRNFSVPERDYDFTPDDGTVGLVEGYEQEPRPVVLEPTRNATLHGVTTLAPGSTVRLQPNGTPDGIELPERTVSVTPNHTGEWNGSDRFDGAISAEWNLSTVPHGTTLTLDVAPTSEELEPQPVVVRWTDAEVTLGANATWVGGSVRVRRTTLPDEGFVVVRASPTGPVMGVSEPLAPGPHENVTVSLRTGRETLQRLVPEANRRVTAVVVRDTDSDGEYDRYDDTAYTMNGTAVRETRLLPRLDELDWNGTGTDDSMPPGDSATPAESPTPIDTATPPAAPSTTESTSSVPSPTTETPGESGPGFGVVATILGVIVAGWYRATRGISRRRTNR
jgi:hypothetical protein